MPIKRSRKGRGPVNAKKVTYDGINFQSGLERYCYTKLKAAKLFELYEGEKFQLIDSFEFSGTSYERQVNGKGEFTQRGGKKILGISYKPDFTGKDYIIECKGRANETFPIRYKLFKRHLSLTGDKRILYKPQCQTEVDRMIQLILEYRKNGR